MSTRHYDSDFCLVAAWVGFCCDLPQNYLVRHCLPFIHVREDNASDMPRMNQGRLAEQCVQRTEQGRRVRQAVEALELLECLEERRKSCSAIVLAA